MSYYCNDSVIGLNVFSYRKTQWERPVAGDVGTLNMEISSNSDPNSTSGSPRLSPVHNVSSTSTVSITTTSIPNPKVSL